MRTSIGVFLSVSLLAAAGLNDNANATSTDLLVVPFSDFEAAFHAGVEEVHRRSLAVGGFPSSAEAARIHATGRDDFEDWANTLDIELVRALGEEFRGVAIHPVERTVFVGTATSGEIEAKVLAAIGLPPEYAIEFVEVSSTVGERDEVVARLDEVGVTSYGAMTLDDAVRLHIDDSVVAELVGQAVGAPDLATRFADLAEHQSLRAGALVVTRGEMSDGEDSLSAGVTNFRANGSAYCTFGPNVVEIATGTRYATTSGHCDDGVWRNGNFFARREGKVATGEDWAVHHIPSALAPGIGKVWVSSTWSIPIHGPWRSHMTGSSRNMKGRVTGYTTGVYAGQFCGLPAATYSRAGGDSGGPVVYHYGTPRIVGLHEGPCSYYDPNQSTAVNYATYSPVYALELGGGTTAQYRVLRHDE